MVSKAPELTVRGGCGLSKYYGAQSRMATALIFSQPDCRGSILVSAYTLTIVDYSGDHFPLGLICCQFQPG